MDIQTRKLNLIIYLALLQDESFFDKYILSKLEKEDYSEFVPLSIETLISRIEKSEEDLENLSANW